MKITTVLSILSVTVAFFSVGFFASSIITPKWIEGYKSFNSKAMDKALNMMKFEGLGEEIKVPTYIGLQEICQILQGITDDKIIFAKTVCQSYKELRKLEEELKHSHFKNSGIIELMDRILNPLNVLYILLITLVVMVALSMIFSSLRLPVFKIPQGYLMMIYFQSVLLFAVCAMMGLAIMVYAELQLSNGSQYLEEQVSVLQNILPNVDAKNVILHLIHYDYYRGLSHVLAWCGEVCLIMAFLFALAEMYVVKTKPELLKTGIYGRFDL